MTTKREIEVYAGWHGIEKPFRMGILTSERLKGKEVFSFAYDHQWLEFGPAQNIDPQLQWYTGPQYLTGNKSNFGVFLDSSPDRWGRVLMRRREAALARQQERKENTLFETDYLLGVFDSGRMGGLRFKLDDDGGFLSNDKEMATPPWTSLGALEHASMRLEMSDPADDPQYLKWLNLLFAPGTSLGGARPKANVLDKNQHLWIAKFPSYHDENNIGGWEIVVHELAQKAGLDVAESLAKKFSGNYHTFITKRFDRNEKSERVHFASALTLLGLNDGLDHTDGVSYLHLAEFLVQQGASPVKDLEQLWRRIVFNICVSNADDHLRNHGFLLSDKGWILSPAFDLNPIAHAKGLKLNISENDNALDLNLAREVAPVFRLNPARANAIIETVEKAVRQWERIADKYAIPKKEQTEMASAFSSH